MIATTLVTVSEDNDQIQDAEFTDTAHFSEIQQRFSP